MTLSMTLLEEQQDVPQTLIRALFHHPHTLQLALHEAGLAPRDLAMWARQQGTAEIEKLAGWLSVGQRLGHHKPLLEVAASHLRSGDLLEALPVFRWAYRAWLTASNGHLVYRYDGFKLLTLWGECLYRLNQPDKALEKWLWALDVVPDEEALTRLARTIEGLGAVQAYETMLAEALRRQLPGAVTLGQRWQRVKNTPGPISLPLPKSDPESRITNPEPRIPNSQSSVAVMADVANLDMVCRDQYGVGRRLDYGRLLQALERHGPVEVKTAFVPDIPETLAVRQHLAQVGFEIDLKRPKRSHGRIVANADTAMAATAVRWASETHMGRVELWTGDGDFLKVRKVVAEAWPQVVVSFRSFEVGTAAGIRRLGADWEPIVYEHLQP